ncbi:MAG: hypothetical protein AAF823_11265 [Planctomycetota bacterium]
MDTATLAFVVFTAFNAATLLAGWWVGKRGLLSAAFSRRLHVCTVVGPWGAMNFLCVWSVPLTWTLLWLAVFPTVLIGVGVGAAFLIGKALRLPRMSLGVVMIAAGVSNTGFTLGGYLCYCLLDDGQGAGAAALAMGVTMVTVMQVSAIPMLYPLASAFAGSGDRPAVWVLVVKSFWDLRAMPLYAGTAGFALNVAGASGVGWAGAPAGVLDAWWVQMLIYAGAFGAHFGIGMNIRPSEALGAWREHATLAACKFAVFPVATAAMLWATGWTPIPAEGLLGRMLWIESFMSTGLMSVMVSNMFRLDARLAANLWVVNTGLFVVGPLVFLILLV